MNIIITKSFEEFNTQSANIVLNQIALKSDSVLGFPTGNTPAGMYRLLVEAYKAKKADFSKIITFNLDEYCGLSKFDKHSYYCFMQSNLFSHINTLQENQHIPDGMANDLQAECTAYDNALAASGGIDLQVLGTGVNGHIGFNEPADALIKNTHITTLTPVTKQSNSVYFENPEQIPDTAITMGLGAIFAAKKILLLAIGENKAEVIKRLYKGEITTNAPVTLLNLHQDVTIILDQEAARLL